LKSCIDDNFSELLAFAYYAQCRCDPAGTVKYFTALCIIVEVLQASASCPGLLQEVVATERSRDRFTQSEVENAAMDLGFGIQNVLHVDYDEDVDDLFIENAWKECVKRSWKDSERGGEILRAANDALRILAEARGSTKLRKVWESGKGKGMSPEKAYDTLEVPKDVDDQMLITVFNMRVRGCVS
jgi:ubiquitin carboxyl-terminal hydrolase 25